MLLLFQLKRLLVKSMSGMCWLIDGIRPWQLVHYTPLRWLGCPRGLALWSSELDEKWKTRVWTKCEQQNQSASDVSERAETNQDPTL